MDNNYSNIIAPSDGVRRFLCKTSVLMVSLLSAVFCACAFRMNMLEADTLGGTLRTGMLCVAYVLLPLGLVTSAIFARVKSMGLAFSMISLLVAAFSAFMLLMNSLASLLREGRLLGISVSLVEFLTFGAFLALLVNLVMSCMDFKIRPVIGNIGAVFSTVAMILTSVRTVLSYSALSFARNSEFEWSNLAELVDTDKLRYHAAWIFRSIPRGNASALHAMYSVRFYERISACLFYGMIIMIFIKYQKEMKAFNKLLDHASEYVEIPTARIYQSIFGSGAKNDEEQSVAVKPSLSGKGSVRRRLRDLANMTHAKEQGRDITDLADSYDAQRAADYYEENMLSRSMADDDLRMETSDEELTEEERYIMEMRRRRSQRSESGEDRPRQRRRDDEFGEERPRQRRRDDEFGEERPRQRRRDDESGEERPRQRELTDQEKYLMEERRKRQRKMNPEGADNKRRRDSSSYGDSRDSRRRNENHYQ